MFINYFFNSCAFIVFNQANSPPTRNHIFSLMISLMIPPFQQPVTQMRSQQLANVNNPINDPINVSNPIKVPHYIFSQLFYLHIPYNREERNIPACHNYSNKLCGYAYIYIENLVIFKNKSTIVVLRVCSHLHCS